MEHEGLCFVIISRICYRLWILGTFVGQYFPQIIMVFLGSCLVSLLVQTFFLGFSKCEAAPDILLLQCRKVSWLLQARLICSSCLASPT